MRFVRAQWHAVTAARRDKPWLHRRDQSGDIVLEQACHQFDIFNWVFGETPRRAVGFGLSLDSDQPGRDVLDQYGVLLDYPGGGQVQLSHLSYSVPDRRFSGIYELAFCEKSGVDLPNALTWDAAGKTVEICHERGNDTQHAVAAFVGSLIHGTPPAADAGSAYRATLTALLARRAIETGDPIEWSSMDGSSVDGSSVGRARGDRPGDGTASV